MSAQNALTRWRLRHKKGLFAKYLSSSFSPPDRANLVGWWDASAITGLSNNDPVSSWADKSGLGNHATQSTADSKPTYKTNQKNGLPVLYGDGGDYLECNSLASEFAGADKPLSCFIVVKRDDTASHDQIVSFEKTDGTAYFVPVAFFQENQFAWKQDDLGAHDWDGWAYTQGTNWMVCSVITNGTLLNSWINGAKIQTNRSQDFGAITFNKFSIFTRLSDKASVTLTGNIGEILLYRSAISDAGQQVIQSYLSAKWGITLA